MRRQIYADTKENTDGIKNRPIHKKGEKAMSIQKCKTCKGKKTVIVRAGCHQEVVCPDCEGTGEVRSHSCREFEREFTQMRKPYSGASAELKKEGNDWEFIYDTLRNGGIIITIKFCPFCGEKLK